MIGDIILAVFAILLYIDAWWAYRKNTKEIDDLRVKYASANEEIRDLKTRTRFLESEGCVLHSIKEKARDFETRIRYLETEEARRKRMQALPEAENKSYTI